MHKLQRRSGFTLIELMMVVGILGVIGAFSVPMFARTIANFRLSGDARSLSNAIAVAKIRAAAKFSRVRLFVDLTTDTHHIETLDRSADPDHWTLEGGSTYLSASVDFSFDPVADAPPDAQAVIGQSVPCTTDEGEEIENTACVIFNSRGTPVDASGVSTAEGALYITDGTAVYGVVISATGMVRLWRTLPTATPTWVLQ